MDRDHADHFAKIASSRTGRGKSKGKRRYAVTFKRKQAFSESVQIDTWASKGTLGDVYGTVHPDDPTRYTVSMELDPAGAALSELRIALREAQRGISEVWLHRWIS